jgi:CRISPR/Cas system CMR-associated protein Cmr5 small subunit
MKIPFTINQAFNIVLIIALLFVSLCSKPTIIVNKGITPNELNYALQAQKEKILQDIDLKIEKDAFTKIENIDSLMAIKRLRDSLRTIALGR